MILCIFQLKMSFPQDLQRLAFSHQQMGTTFRIILYTEDTLAAKKVIDSVFSRIDALNAVLSDYDSKSELSRFSQTAGSQQKVPLSADLMYVLKQSRQFSRDSKGAFDLTIGPLTKLWRRAFRQGKPPRKEAIEAATKLVSYKKLKLYAKRRKGKLAVSGSRLDAGGIAKGFTVDQAYRILRDAGLPIALVDGGGDIYAGEAPPGKPGWKISTKTMASNGVMTDSTLFIANRAIATSGDTYRFLEWQGKRYSHIIDPRTGMGISDQRRVSVMANNCLTADALASVYSILNPKEGKKLARKYQKATITIIFPQIKKQLIWGAKPSSK
ncbi:MAG: FAD:protein FMN transferase [Bacteroidota bacterium]